MMARLGDIAEFINGGAWSDKEYTATGIPVVKVTNLKNGTVDLTEVNYIPESSLDKYARHILRKGDLVIATVGSHPNLVASAAGRATIIPSIAEGALLNQNALCLRTNSELLHQGYFGYLGKSDLFQGYVKSVGRGAANQVRIALGLIKEFSFSLPPLTTQRKIASTLSAYDDLIANNLKRIKLLEEIARITYEEWFVKFCVNGARLETSKTTRLPNNWQMTSIKDYVGFISKGPSLDYNEGDIPVINQSCIRNGEIELEKILYAKELPMSKEDCYLKQNDVLINSMGQGTLGRVSKNVSITEKYIIHNCITVLRAKKELSQYQLFYFMSSKQNYFESIAQGSTGQTTLKISSIEELKIPVPPMKLLRDFDKIVDPLWKQIGCLKKQNTKLREARDILLPKLMNGQIEV